MIISIAIVEDLDEVREGLKNFISLNTEFLVVGAFKTGEEALLKLPGLCPDIVIMDIHLPGMSGLELMEAMRRAKRHLPTILITARCDNAIRERAKALGVVALLEKPIEFNGLMGAIERCTGRPST